MIDKKIWIILAVVLGTLVLLLATTLILFSWKRSKRRIRGFSLRAVTPLDDAEFESWRRPQEKQDTSITQPAAVKDLRNSVYEKELSVYSYEYRRTLSPPPITTLPKSPTSPIRKPERAQRKTSVTSSIADRPPTPYSPTFPPGELARRGSCTSPEPGSKQNFHSHYQSMSESSGFDFNLGSEYGSPPMSSYRPSLQGDQQPLHLSYAKYGDSF